MLTDCVKLLKENFEKDVSAPTICKELKKIGLDLKKLYLHSVKRNSLRVKEARVAFINRLKDNAVNYLEHCVFIDEAAFNTNLRPLRGRAMKGKRALMKVPETRAKNFSIIGAICAERPVFVTTRDPEVEVTKTIITDVQEYQSLKATKKRRRSDAKTEGNRNSDLVKTTEGQQQCIF